MSRRRQMPRLEWVEGLPTLRWGAWGMLRPEVVVMWRGSINNGFYDGRIVAALFNDNTVCWIELDKDRDNTHGISTVYGGGVNTRLSRFGLRCPERLKRVVESKAFSATQPGQWRAWIMRRIDWIEPSATQEMADDE